MSGSFEPVAAWYDEHVGDEGSFYHHHLILPALLGVLGDIAGLCVLDIGCGSGVLSRILARRGARVTGVDLSPTLIARAVEREEARPLGITYLVADAADLSMLPDGSFSSVTAQMVLMDASDGAGILREAGRLLEPNGRFVASLLHPCFAVPGRSAWETQPEGKGERFVRRIWGYRELFSCPDYLAPEQPLPITRYHRPLGWYVTRLREAGMLVDALEEPVGDADFAREKPQAQQRQRIAPSFMVLGATKVAHP